MEGNPTAVEGGTTGTTSGPGRRRWAVVAAAVVGAVLAAGGAAVVVHHVQTAATVRRLAPPSASSEQVLRVYLRAAVAHDCALTEALTAADAPQTPGAAWCGQRRPTAWWDDHPDMLAYRNVRAAERIPADERGGVAEECIPVDVTETNMTGDDPGVLPGWEFCFRQTADGWRLYDEGYG